jgi:hypothetical protein
MEVRCATERGPRLVRATRNWLVAQIGSEAKKLRASGALLIGTALVVEQQTMVSVLDLKPNTRRASSRRSSGRSSVVRIHSKFNRMRGDVNDGRLNLPDRESGDALFRHGLSDAVLPVPSSLENA